MNTFLQRIHHLDTLLFLWLHVTKRYPYRKSIRWISRSGDGPFYIVITLIILFLDSQQSMAFLAAGLLAYVGEVSLYLLLKNTIRRDRPAVRIETYEAWIVPSDKFSFPSGHTAAAFVFACLLLQFYPLFAAPAFIWASLIGASRVLLGVHYPSDIAAGTLLGCSCAFTAIFLTTPALS